MKRAILFAGFVAGVLGGPAVRGIALAQDPVLAAADRARVRGAETARVWLVIVGDFTSDANSAFRRNVWPMMDSLYVRPGRLRVAWVNLPGESKHSQIAAEVAACSGAHMKFWSVHDIFLDEQARWRSLADPTAALVDAATRRGGDPIWISECLKKRLVSGFLRANAARARVAGIRAAPGFILDNKVLVNVRTADEFRQAIEGALRVGR
jgi:protein-disulfide isomerase